MRRSSASLSTPDQGGAAAASRHPGAIDAIRSHLQRDGLSDGLVFDAVRARLLEIGEGAPSIGTASAHPSLMAADSR